jgi:pseudomonalisin
MSERVLSNRFLRWLLALSTALVLCGMADAGLAAGSGGERGGDSMPVPKVRINGPVDDDDRVTLSGNRHPRLVHARDMGRASDSLQVERMILSLAGDADQNAALEHLLVATHDTASPQFGQWLSAKEFEQRFGVSDQDLATVSAWLTSHGFTIDEIPAGRRSIVFSGSSGQIRRAFHTEMRHYEIGKERHLANASDPQIPDALSAVVSGVVSLHDFRSRPLHSTVKVAPEYTSGNSHALAPADFNTIYNATPLAAQAIDGAGRTIAILGRTNIVMSDIQKFRSTMGLSANLPQVIINGSDPGRQSGDEGESDLDLEWAGAVAPAATIKFITSASTASTDGIDLSAQYAVSNNVADIISLSYGSCEKDMGTTWVNFYNNLWQQATAQGMTVFVSSGDSGAAGCDGGSSTTATGGRYVNGLCSSPYSTCVGGTQFDDTANPAAYWSSSNNATTLGSALSYIPEVVWNESGNISGGSGLWASGGGASTNFTKPSWQTGLGIPSDGKRDVPDVSLTAASHDGYLVYSSDDTSSTQTRYIFGGTSASAPSFAGIMALINQKTGYRAGNANPRFYQLAASQASGGPAYYHQVISGNNSVPGQVGFAASASTPYFNLATGLGSVDINVLVNHWTDVLPATTTTLTASAASIAYKQGVTFTATVAGTSPSGNVQFWDGATALGSAVTLTGGTAALTTTGLTVGSHAVAAVYSGDAANHASTSSTLAVAVTQVTTTISLVSSSPAATQGQSVTFTVVVSGTSPGGAVQFFDGSTLIGTATLVSCTASLSTSALSVGSHNITAVYSGDTNNQASTSPVVVETVTAVVTQSSTALAVAPASIAAGQVVTLTATVTGNSPSGSVQFKDGGSNLVSAVALSGNTAILSTTGLSAVGSHTITAEYSGDASNIASASSGVVVSVTRAVSSLTLASSSASITAGQNVTFTATVSGFSPGGTVQFIDGATALGSATVTTGLASLSTTSLSVGSHEITAIYSGDAGNFGSTSAVLVETVSASGGDTADAPTLPQWGAILLGAIMLLMGRRRGHA